MKKVNKTNKNYTISFIDEDLNRKFYFAGFVRTMGGWSSTGCEVITKTFTKEDALKIKARIIKYNGNDNKSLRLVKVGK